MQGNEKLLSKLNESRGLAKDLIASKLCSIQIRAVGLDFEVTKWIEKNLKGLRDCFELS
jgi:hypothetical protein